MKPYAETEIFVRLELERLETARKIVERIPDPEKGEETLRCHEIARVAGKILNLPVVDGKFGPVDHSWLEITLKPAHKRGEKVRPYTHVLDVYAVGSHPQVKLVDTSSGLLPYHELYVKGEERKDIRHWTVDKLVELLTIDKDRRRICHDCLDKRATKTWPDHLRSNEEPTSFLCEDCQFSRRSYCSHPRFRRVDSHLPDECCLCGE